VGTERRRAWAARAARTSTAERAERVVGPYPTLIRGMAHQHGRVRGEACERARRQLRAPGLQQRLAGAARARGLAAGLGPLQLQPARARHRSWPAAVLLSRRFEDRAPLLKLSQPHTAYVFGDIHDAAQQHPHPAYAV